MRILSALCAALLFVACGSGQKPRADEPVQVVVPPQEQKTVEPQPEEVKPEEPKYKKPGEYSFRLLVSDVGINDPALDHRSYYRVFIDKTESGRTTIGLESQEKSFDALLAPNRHLIVIEKFVLDEKKGKYLKLNRIDQPHPDYFYIELPPDRVLILTCLRDAKTGIATYSTEFEREQ